MKALLLHGIGGCSLDWETAGALSRVDATAVDLPFHGGRPLDREVSFDALVDDVLRSLPDGDVALAGFSLGASVALACAARVPDRIRALLLVAAVWPCRTAPPSTTSFRKLGRIVARRGLTFAWDVVRAVPPICGWDDDDRNKYRERFLGFDALAFAAALRELPCQRPHINVDAVRADVRTTVVGWGDDRIHPLSTAAEVADRLDARLVVETGRPTDRKVEARVLAAHLDEALTW